MGKRMTWDKDARRAEEMIRLRCDECGYEGEEDRKGLEVHNWSCPACPEGYLEKIGLDAEAK